MSGDDVINRAIEDIADGRAIDWPALDSGALSDEERERLKCLRIVSEVAVVHRSTEDPGADEEVTTERVTGPPLPAHDDAEAWGRYRLVEKVGEGSFGNVYRAWDPELEREIAIKILHPRFGDSRLKERLLREGRALARVRHANVVSVFGVESYGDRVGLCMEFVRGETLAAVVRTHGTLNAREAGLIGEDVCRALAAVHRAGFVHCDVKARNVMREQAGRIVLMDFGTGQEIEPHDTGARLNTSGTPMYMAPEVLAGQPVSACSDIYSVGVLLYHVVTSEYPVEGRTMDELRDAHRQRRRRLLSERRPDLPMAFIRVVERALAASPEERWPSAGALLEALDTVSGNVEPRTGTQRILLGATILVAVLLAVTLLGFINSIQFNVMLERHDVAAESPVDWLIWGLRSLVGPVANLAQVLIVVFFVAAIVRLVRRLWPTADRFSSRILEAFARARTRVSFDDPAAFAQVVFVVGAAYLGVVFWVHWRLISAGVNSISALTPEQRAIWSPDNVSQHILYLTMLDYLVLGLGLSLFRLVRMRRARSMHGSPVYVAAVAATLGLAAIMWEAPYRLMFQAQRPRIEFEHQRCYNLGRTQIDSLIYCPEGNQPKVRRVPQNDSRIHDTGVTESVFSRGPGR